MKEGLKLIRKERKEQVYKHGFSLEHDAEFYKNKELVQAAEFCLLQSGFIKDRNVFWPEGWDIHFMNKVLNKTKIGQMVVAGAFLMAENERRKDKFWSDYIKIIAEEINKQLSI